MSCAPNIDHHDASRFFDLELHENILTDAASDRDMPETNSILESEDEPHVRPSWQCATYGDTSESWEHRKPPTELQALDALNEIKELLRPQYSGHQKWYKELKIPRWGQNILGQLKIFLMLFMGANSKVKEKWMEASKEAAIATSIFSNKSSRTKAS